MKTLRQALIWFMLLFKRALKKPSLIIIVILMPVLVTAVNHAVQNGLDISVNVGLYADESDSAGSYIASRLTNADIDDVNINADVSKTNIGGIFKYTLYDSREALLQAVISSEVTCGYAFCADLSEKLSDGGSVPEDLIEVIYPKNSPAYILVNELIYSGLIDYYSYILLKNDTLGYDDIKELDREFVEKRLKELYDGYRTGNSTFRFVYNADGKDMSKKIDVFNYFATPVKGFIAIIIFLAGLIGGLIWYKDMNRNAFSLLTGKKRLIVGFIDIFIPTLIASASGFISIIIADISDDILTDLLRLIIYAFMVSAYTFLLCMMLKNIHIYSSIIPMLLMGCLVFCPIFINIATFMPSLKYVRLLFPPNYYLMLLT